MRRFPVRSWAILYYPRYGQNDFKDEVYGPMLDSPSVGTRAHLRVQQANAMQVCKVKGKTSDDILDFLWQVLRQVVVFLPRWVVATSPRLSR